MPEDKKIEFKLQAKRLEDSYLLIKYQGMDFSLQEILFKSLYYSSITDLLRRNSLSRLKDSSI